MGKVFKALEKAGIDPNLLDSDELVDDKMSIDEEKPLDTQKETAKSSPVEPEARVNDTQDVSEHQVKKDLVVEEGLKPAVTKENTLSRARLMENKQAGAWDERLVKVTALGSAEAETFRTLRSKILYPTDGKPVPRTIMVTSAAPSEGKGFVTANLAISLARGMDQYSLLVDCDLRRPSLAKMFGLNNEFGLVNCLQEQKGVENYLQKTSIDKLSLLASGRSPANPAELLGSTRMGNIISELTDRYDDRFIIFDSAPGQVASESFVLAKRVDGVVLVVRYGKSHRNHVKNLVESIGRDKIIGVVFNGVKTSMLEKKVFGDYDSYGDYYHQEEAV